MNLLAYIAERIRSLRQGYGGEGLSQEALARHIGVATNTISRWETGENQPRGATLKALKDLQEKVKKKMKR